ncbi:MAG TPA: sugar phosphate isomerase/epimerase [Tepidisphaeraceae bacterium]|jgi:sugar phosphate isomerase/epimerase|nr:sugar phosphate isomerase/epimerase [Tepidisphaeraceae bacterium]
MPRTPLKLAVVASALSSDPRTAPRIARESGFSGLVLNAFSANLNFPDLSATGRREIRHLLSADEQQLVALQVPLGPKGLGTEADVDQILSRFRKVIEAARDLGALCVCVDLGPLPPPEQSRKPKPPVSPQQAGLIILPPSMGEVEGAESPEPTPLSQADRAFLEHVDTAMAELCSLADRTSMTIACSSSLASFASLERTLLATRCPWIGVDLDPVAILRDEQDVDEIFSNLGGLIRHVRGRDATKGADRRTVPAVIGRGSTNWEQFLNHLDGAGYHGWITIDPMELQDRQSAAIAGLKKVRSFSL